ncbi:MAG: hypothetical protein AMS15_05215 [Planctomycetes bacterium DG_23]|nr:MAG: hypothetical protein AMS15_05215 [Planctomycetes bacterium DG_23]
MCPEDKEPDWVIKDKKSWPPLWQASQELPVVKGEAEVVPKEAIAGRLATLRLTVIPAEPIARGGRILVNLPRGLGGRANFFLPLGFVPVEEHPGYGAAVSVQSSNAQVRLLLHIMCDISFAGTWAILEAMVSEGKLEPSDEVTFVIGDPRGALVRLPEHSQRGLFQILIDAKGDGQFRRLEVIPAIDIKGDFPERFLLFAPKALKTDEPFSLSIVAADKVNFNPSSLYQGEAALTATDPKALLPEEIIFKKSDAGFKRAEGLEFKTKGVHRITALDAGSGIIGRSGPVCVDWLSTEKRIYFGEIHPHTYLSDGSGTPEEALRWARDARGLDFSALADHWRKSLAQNPKTKEEYLKTINAFNEPGRFVTLVGYEWTTWSSHGDKCVYFRGPDGPFLAPDDPETDDPQKLWKALKGVAALTIPHHPMAGGRTDWGYKNDEFERLVEIFSWWGCAEEGSEFSVQAALAQGHKLGFIGGTDNHFGQPGTGRTGAEDGAGLAAVFAQELTREAIFDALWARHCYATTGARMVLEFFVNGKMMGEEIEVPSGGRSEITARAAGTREIENLELIKNNEVIASKKGDGSVIEFRYEDKMSRPGDYYYFRVLQIDGQRAWSSPVWLL